MRKTSAPAFPPADFAETLNLPAATAGAAPLQVFSFSPRKLFAPLPAGVSVPVQWPAALEAPDAAIRIDKVIALEAARSQSFRRLEQELARGALAETLAYIVLGLCCAAIVAIALSL